MAIVYIVRLSKQPDNSYNTLWEGLWVYAEISLGIILICLMTLPKFIQAKGDRIQNVCWNLTRPVVSLASDFVEHLVHSSTNSIPSRATTLNESDMSDHGISRGQDLNSDFMQRDIHEFSTYSPVQVADASHKV